MKPPTPPKILTCGHVEHPPNTGHCMTTDCPNHQPANTGREVYAVVGGQAYVTTERYIEMLNILGYAEMVNNLGNSLMSDEARRVLTLIGLILGSILYDLTL